jgi:hypothetical protein
MLQSAVSSFLQRWHALEDSLGDKGGLVVDFDMAPRSLHGRARSQPYPDRWAALVALGDLRTQVAGAPALANRGFLLAKLTGADAYLRALLGERAPFEDYLAATMGLCPKRADLDALAAEAQALASAFASHGIRWAPEGREAFRACFGRGDLSTFETDLRGAAEDLVARLRARLPSIPAPDFRVESAHADAYWSNWIDGSVENGVLLQVNTHPRIEYLRFSHQTLAAHEISGHACHVAGLRSSGPDAVDPCTLNLAVHSCEAFQMEGLAQAMLQMLVPASELGEELMLLERYRAYTGTRVNEAQLDLEAGAPIDAVSRGLQRDVPLGKAMGMLSSLRDRSRNPLFRTYIHVYAPSRALFLTALDLEPAHRDAFLQAAVTRLWTPSQLARLLAGDDADTVAAEPDPGPLEEPIALGR